MNQPDIVLKCGFTKSDLVLLTLKMYSQIIKVKNWLIVDMCILPKKYSSPMDILLYLLLF